MNWDDPEARAQLIESVGAEEYNRLFQKHYKNSVIETVNGHAIRAVLSQRFGRIYMVDGINKGHSTLEGARKIAQEATP